MIVFQYNVILINTKFRALNLIPFRLHNISDFVVTPHPLIFPETLQYDEYWLPQIQRCIEGHWGYDYHKGLGGWRWMPGNLYFYTNMGWIEVGGDENRKAKDHPKLRDVEWLIFYGLTVCDGFSGFVDDPNECCFLPIKKIEKNQELSELDKIFIEKYGMNYRKNDGSWKKYKEPKAYLYQVFKDSYGRAMFHNPAQNFEVLSTRRLGKSFIFGQGIIAYDFTFNGARTLTDFLDKTTKSTTVVGAVDYKYSAELLGKVELCYDNLRTSVGAYRKDGLDFPGCMWHPIDGWSRMFKTKGGSVTNSILNKSGQGTTGVGSQIVHVTYKVNASAGVGYGARRMVIDEVGLLPSFSAVHGENDATQKHDYKYGMSVYAGTGGNIEKIKEVKDSFYNPEKYGILSYPNLSNASGKPTALFLPSYYKNNIFRDAQGNLDVERSFQYEIKELEKLKGSKRYQTHQLSFPLIQEHMFLQSSGNIFDTEAIEDRLAELENDPHPFSIGSLHYVDELNRKVVWTEDIDKKLMPFISIGDEVGQIDKKGAIIIYEHPKFYKPSRYDKNPLYITLYDPVAISTDEGGEGSSLACVLVIKLMDFNDSYLAMNVVAEWYGRHGTIELDHKQAFMISDYYESMLFPEVNVEDILRYAKKNSRYFDLEDWPGFSASEVSAFRKKRIKGFKIPSSTQGKHVLLEYLNEYLDIPVYKEEQLIGKEEIIKEIKVKNRIPSKRLCEEIKDYNTEENFDGVSCLLLLGLWYRNRTLTPINEEKEYIMDASIDDFVNTFNPAAATVHHRHPAFNY